VSVSEREENSRAGRTDPRHRGKKGRNGEAQAAVPKKRKVFPSGKYTSPIKGERGARCDLGDGRVKEKLVLDEKKIYPGCRKSEAIRLGKENACFRGSKEGTQIKRSV